MRRRLVAISASAAVAFVTGFAGIAIQHAAAATTVVSTPTNTNGWFTEDGAPAYVADSNAIDGLGELKFSTPLAASKNNWFHFAGTSYASGVPLTSVNGLS